MKTKSQLLKKLLKKYNKKRKHLGIPKCEMGRFKLARMEPNDMMGYLMPPKAGPFTVPRSMQSSPPPWYRPDAPRDERGVCIFDEFPLVNEANIDEWLAWATPGARFIHFDDLDGQCG